MLSSHLSCPHTLPQIAIPQGTMKKCKCQYRSPATAICKRTKQSCFILSFALWSLGRTQLQKLHTEQNKHTLGRAHVSGDKLTMRSPCGGLPTRVGKSWARREQKSMMLAQLMASLSRRSSCCSYCCSYSKGNDQNRVAWCYAGAIHTLVFWPS